MPLSDKQIHLSSDEHKNHLNKIWCELCDKYITDKTRHFQSETHLLKAQKFVEQPIDSGPEVEKIFY